MKINKKAQLQVLCRNCGKKLIECKELHQFGVSAWKHEESGSHYCYPDAEGYTYEFRLMAEPKSD
jgi:hypothetical protein